MAQFRPGWLALAIVSIVAGCATGTPDATTSPTDLPSATNTTSSPRPSATVPSDPAKEFRVIADASCDKTNAEGVTESTTDARLFLIPKDDAYKDFNAGFYTADDGTGLIWSTEDFNTCNASNAYSMAELDGGTYALDVTFDEASAQYVTRRDGEGKVDVWARYEVRDGVFSRALLGPKDNLLVFDIRYGMPSEADIEILHTEVDKFLANNP